MRKVIILLTPLVFLAGCVAQPTKTSVTDSKQFETIKFSPTLGTELAVETGDDR